MISEWLLNKKIFNRLRLYISKYVLYADIL